MRLKSNVILALSTLVAAIFVAVQAWYARVAFVEEMEARFREKQLELCFESFDAAAALDAELRIFSVGNEWPPRVTSMSEVDFRRIQRDIVPRLNTLEASLAKAALHAPLDKFRGFLFDRLEGISERISSVSYQGMANEVDSAEFEVIIGSLDDFLGAQYPVFEGCRSEIAKS